MATRAEFFHKKIFSFAKRQFRIFIHSKYTLQAYMEKPRTQIAFVYGVVSNRFLL